MCLLPNIDTKAYVFLESKSWDSLNGDMWKRQKYFVEDLAELPLHDL